jgi:hypothetical protein
LLSRYAAARQRLGTRLFGAPAPGESGWPALLEQARAAIAAR